MAIKTEFVALLLGSIKLLFILFSMVCKSISFVVALFMFSRSGGYYVYALGWSPNSSSIVQVSFGLVVYS